MNARCPTCGAPAHPRMQATPMRRESDYETPAAFALALLTWLLILGAFLLFAVYAFVAAVPNV